MEALVSKKQFLQPKVLVIDDDPFFVSLVESLFKAENCQVQTALNGSKAVKEIYEHDFHLVVIDWKMPYLNGRLTLRFSDWILQAIEGDFLKKIPIIINSGMSPEKVNFPDTQSFVLVDYWRKQENLKNLQSRIKNVLGRIERGTL